MENPEMAAVLYITVPVFSFIITFFILRWIFDIKFRSKQSSAQTALLAEIALKSGVDGYTVEKIVYASMDGDEDKHENLHSVINRIREARTAKPNKARD